MSEREHPARAGGVREEPWVGTARRSENGERTAEDAGPVLARLERPRSAKPTTIAVVADPHCSTRRTGSWKCFHRAEHRLREAVADCNRQGVDALVVAGDLTANGHRRDFDRVHDVVAGLNAPAFAVPGNHDVPKEWDDHETPAVSEFERRFTPGQLPFHESVGGVDLIGIDTARAPDGDLSDTHAGRASHDQLGWLDDALPRVKTPVVVGHHNLSASLPGAAFAGERPSYPVRDDTALLETLAVHDVPLYCSGHVHVPAVAENAGVRELVVPPLSSFPQGYVRLDVGPEGTTVRYVPVAGPDEATEAYLAARAAGSVTEAVSETVLAQLSALPLRDEHADAR
jgi:3',5'-cyclic AMP phosphodiesterase CpdA